MEVLCVGLPRNGTESLQQALLKLGYDYTFHVSLCRVCHLAQLASFGRLYYQHRSRANIG